MQAVDRPLAALEGDGHRCRQRERLGLCRLLRHVGGRRPHGRPFPFRGARRVIPRTVGREHRVKPAEDRVRVLGGAAGHLHLHPGRTTLVGPGCFFRHRLPFSAVQALRDTEFTASFEPRTRHTGRQAPGVARAAPAQGSARGALAPVKVHGVAHALRRASRGIRGQ